MKKYFILTFFLCCSLMYVAAQKEDNIWVFGYHAGLDFNSGSPVHLPIQTAIYSAISAASISDETGALLFYTDGSGVWDRNHNLMSNSIGITPGVVPSNISGRNNPVQVVQIVPFIGDANKYYLFTNKVPCGGGNLCPLYSELFYSVVDMSLNGGLGDVVPGQKGVLIDSFVTSGLAAVNGTKCNRWVVVRDYYSDNYKSYEISRTGLDTTPVLSQARAILSTPIVLGQPMLSAPGFPFGSQSIKFSPSGLKIASHFGINTDQMLSYGIELYDFDPFTGIVSNATVLYSTSSPCPVHSFDFSPDGSKFYYSYFAGAPVACGALCQIDFSTNTTTVLGPHRGSALRRGPDGKMYSNGTPVRVINYPDSFGHACDAYSSTVPLLTATLGMSALPSQTPSRRLPASDTVYNSRQEITACLKGPYNVLLTLDTTGFGYIWNTGDSSYRILANEPGIYVGGWQKECTYYVDSFIVRRYPVPAPVTIITGTCPDRADGELAAVLPDHTEYSYTYTYNWYDNANNPLRTTTSQNGDTLKGLSPGNYKLVISFSSGCDTTFTFNIKAFPGLAQFAAGYDTTIFPGASVQLFATGAAFYNWQPKRWLDDPESATPVATPQTGITYTVTGSNEYGCTDTAQVHINLIEDFLIPNAFSPNGDGINDVFKITNPGFHKIHSFSIYNRFGQRVFTTVNSSQGWDGTYKDQPAEMGTYYYLIELQLRDGAMKMFKGDVILIR